MRVRADDGHAVVEAHNERSIPDESAESVEPFAARGVKPHHTDGLGLRPFIAKSIVRAHHGGLQVDSSPERGTIFRLVLPRAA